MAGAHSEQVVTHDANKPTEQLIDKDLVERFLRGAELIPTLRSELWSSVTAPWCSQPADSSSTSRPMLRTPCNRHFSSWRGGEPRSRGVHLICGLALDVG